MHTHQENEMFAALLSHATYPLVLTKQLTSLDHCNITPSTMSGQHHVICKKYSTTEAEKGSTKYTTFSMQSISKLQLLGEKCNTKTKTFFILLLHAWLLTSHSWVILGRYTEKPTDIRYFKYRYWRRYVQHQKIPNTDDKIPKIGSVFASTLSRDILWSQNTSSYL